MSANPEPRAEEPIAVTVVTGFLGSGKTTLLRRLLAHPAMGDTAVIINEFGEIGLDHLLIETAFDDAILMKSGCVCCTLRGDLIDTLVSLLDRRTRGEIPPFRRVVIETTGLADPAPILHALMADPAVIPHYRLGCVVTTVDVLNALGQFAKHYESVKQAAVADRLVLTKIDLAQAHLAGEVAARLNALNPSAPILRVVDGEIEPAALFGNSETARDHGGFDIDSVLRAAGIETHHHAHGADDHHVHGIDSICLIRNRPVRWSALRSWLEALVSLRGPDLLRLKGIVAVEGRSRPVVIHAVHHVLHTPQELTAWPDGNQCTRIVLITRNIPRHALEASFETVTGAGSA
jgi:G3E family GTPase